MPFISQAMMMAAAGASGPAGEAILDTFVATRPIWTTGASSVSVTSLALQEGDIVFVSFVEDGGTLNPPAPTDFTVIHSEADTVVHGLYYRVMGETPITSVSGLRTASDGGSLIWGMRGLDADDLFADPPYNTWSYTETSTGSGLPASPNIIPENDNTVLLTVGWLDDDYVYPTISGWTQIGSGGKSNKCTTGAFYLLNETGGSQVSVPTWTTQDGHGDQDSWVAGNDANRATGIAFNRSYHESCSCFTSATGPDGASGVTSGDYKYHIFENTKTGSNGFSVETAGDDGVEYLIISGGGGGGGNRGGGGGGGGYMTATSFDVLDNTNYDITIGSGGNGASSSSQHGGSGTSSSFAGLAPLGGGGGGYSQSNSPYPGKHGGSGGGGGGGNEDGGYYSPAGGFALEHSLQQGNDGGNGGNNRRSGAGGGGAGGVGGSQGGEYGMTGGDGGAGLSSSITGSPVGRAGGGAGNGIPSGTASDGGGSSGQYAAGGDGTANKGAGGGGAYYPGDNGPGGNGGKGVVIIRYKYQ